MSIRQRNAHFKDWAAVCNALNVVTESEARTALESSDNTFYYYVCYIKDTQEIYTHGKFYDGKTVNLDEIYQLIEDLTAKVNENEEVVALALSELNSEVKENEEVTAQALSDLNNNKANTDDIPTKMSDLENDSNYLKSTATDAGTLLVDGGPYAFNNLVVSTDGSINDGGCVISSNGDILTSGAIVSPSYGFSLTDKLIFADNAVKLTTNDSTRILATTDDIPTAETVAGWGFVTDNDFVESLLNSTRLSFYCIEPVDVILNGTTLTYQANSNVDMQIEDGDTFEIVPTSDNSILSLTAYPGALNTFYSWLEGVSTFSNIIFDMNDLSMYEKWNQGHQGQYHVQMAQYVNCVFWSDNPYISDVASRTNYTLYSSSQLPLCYSSIPANTYKAFYSAYGVTSDPNWSNPAYKESFAAATWATQTFSYYGLQTIGVYDMDSSLFNITLPADCRGLMFSSPSIENAGVFDAVNTTTFGAKSGSWREAFGYCYALTNLFIKNLKVSLNLSWSPINQYSLNYIVENADNTSAITISLSPHTYYQLTDSIKTLAESKNITLALISTNASQDSRLAWLVNNGDGTMFLSNTGEYLIPNYPSKVSQLENDSNYATVDDVDTAISELVGSAPDTLNTIEELSTALKNDATVITTLESAITNKADKTEIPSKTSQLTNDSGFITEIPDNVVTKDQVGDLSTITIGGFTGGIDSLVYALPGNETGDEDYTLVSNIELNTKQDTLVSGTNIKTINGESLLGGGNIEISGNLTTEQLVRNVDPNRIIVYTTDDETIVSPSDVFNVNIISNTYNDGKGIIIFDGDVTDIGDGAFEDCTSLTSISIPNSVTRIGISAFDNCSGLTSISIPDGVTEIGGGAFFACSNLKEINIPANITVIPNTVIVNSKITNIIIPDGVTTIGASAFYATYLTSVTIPDSVTSIGDVAFGLCYNLTNVYCTPTTPPTAVPNSSTGNWNMLASHSDDCKIYVPYDSVEAYKTADGWSDYADIIVGYHYDTGLLKTINGSSIIGSGDVNISDIYVLDFTLADIYQVNSAGDTYIPSDGTLIFNAGTSGKAIYINSGLGYNDLIPAISNIADDWLYLTFIDAYQNKLVHLDVSGSQEVEFYIYDLNLTDLSKLNSAAKGTDVGLMIPSGYIEDSNLIYALPSSATGEEDDIISTKNTLKTINGESLIGSGENIAVVTSITVNGSTCSTSDGNINLPSLATTSDLLTKQDKLVSGTNIKTINGNSLLGSGNINLNPITTIAQSSGTIQLLPNMPLINTTALSGSASLMIYPATDTTYESTWSIRFITSSSTAPTITIGVRDTSCTILWANGTAPTFEAGKVYEISFKQIDTYYLGVCGVFSAS